MASLPRFERQTIYSGEPSERTLCVVGDIDGDGQPEIIVGARSPRGELYWIGRDYSGSWQTHSMDASCGRLEAGGALVDITGGGPVDFIAGHDHGGDRLYWWQPQDDLTLPWRRREICRMPGPMTHDQMSADLDGDGRPEIYFWNQGARLLLRATIPPDPTISPWDTIAVVASDVAEEGLATADLDGDGRPELIAGQSWYRLRDGAWERHEFTEGYVSPKVVAADFDGDGRPEIVLAEGDASIFRRDSGRLVRFHCGADPEAAWEPEVLHDDLLDPHTLQVADFDGDGRPDLLVAEIGDPNGEHPRPPAVMIYQNQSGDLREHVVAEGLSVHDGKTIEIDGRTGFVAKPFQNLHPGRPRDPAVDSVHLWLPT